MTSWLFLAFLYTCNGDYAGIDKQEFITFEECVEYRESYSNLYGDHTVKSQCVEINR